MNNFNNRLCVPNTSDYNKLEAMRMVARMRERADKLGVGFVGGFVAPNGQKFVMTNMDDVDTNALMAEDLK